VQFLTDIDCTVAEFKDVDLLSFLNWNPVAYSLSMHENIQELQFEQCKLWDNEFAAICKELSFLKKLKSVNFSRNEISNIGIDYFSDFLKSFSNKLNLIDFSGNPIKDEGIQSLASAIGEKVEKSYKT